MIDNIEINGKHYTYHGGDEFNDPDLPFWYKDPLLTDPLHRAGNSFLDADGNIMEHKWQSAPGSRWAARYDINQDLTGFIGEQGLVMRPVLQTGQGINKLRENFDFDGTHYPYADNIISLAWHSTASRIWSERHKRHITDFSKPLYTIGPGCYIEYEIDFSRMNSRNVRHSLWLMPLHLDGLENTPDNPAKLSMSDSYDEDVSEVEDDLHEFIHSRRLDYSLLSMKLVAGQAGDTPNGTIDLKQMHGPLTLEQRLMKGPVKFGHIWAKDGSRTWFINDIEVQHDPRAVLTQSYFVNSMEACSGVKAPVDEIKEGDIPANGPKRPRDPGLDGRAWILDTDIVGHCETHMRYLRVYKEGAEKTSIVVKANLPTADEFKKAISEHTDDLGSVMLDLEEPDKLEPKDSPTSVDLQNAFNDFEKAEIERDMALVELEQRVTALENAQSTRQIAEKTIIEGERETGHVEQVISSNRSRLDAIRNRLKK